MTTCPPYEELVAFLTEEAEFISPVQPFPSCRDRDDDYLLALARDGQANFLVSNDQDLLSLTRMEEGEIITPEEFACRLAERRA